ncbi:hypothetical protein Tco_0392851 [Tanacetum coccineum]
MLNDPTNQIPGSSSNPGSSTQPAFNQMPYYPNPNYQPQFTNQEELLMFQHFKMQQMHQQQPQQLPNQFTTSQPHSEQQPHHLEVKDTEDQDEPVPTPTSKPSRDVRLKSKAKKNKEKEPPLEKQKRIRNAWTQDEELLLAECFIQVSEDPKTGCKHKWTNPDSTLQRRNRLLGTDEEPEHFGDDDLPRPPGLQRLAKSQVRVLTAYDVAPVQTRPRIRIHGEQFVVRRKAKMTVLERE